VNYATLIPYPLVLLIPADYDGERAALVLAVADMYSDAELAALISVRAWVVAREMEVN